MNKKLEKIEGGKSEREKIPKDENVIERIIFSLGEVWIHQKTKNKFTHTLIFIPKATKDPKWRDFLYCICKIEGYCTSLKSAQEKATEIIDRQESL